MQTLQRRRCQTRTRLRKKACVYGVRVSGTTIFDKVYADGLYRGFYIPGAARSVQLTLKTRF